MLSDQWPIPCRQSPDGFRFWRRFSHRGSVNFLNSPLVSKQLAARRANGAALSAVLLAVAGSPALILTQGAAPPRATCGEHAKRRYDSEETDSAAVAMQIGRERVRISHDAHTRQDDQGNKKESIEPEQDVWEGIYAVQVGRKRHDSSGHYQREISRMQGFHIVRRSPFKPESHY